MIKHVELFIQSKLDNEFEEKLSKIINKIEASANNTNEKIKHLSQKVATDLDK